MATERAERRFSTGLRLNVSLCGFGFIMGFLLHRVRLTARQIGSRYLREAHERKWSIGFKRIIPLLHQSSTPFTMGTHASDGQASLLRLVVQQRDPNLREVSPARLRR